MKGENGLCLILGSGGGDALARPIGVEVVTHVRDQLTIRRMVRRLQSHDALRYRRGVSLRVAQQVQFGDGRPHEEELLAASEESQHTIEKPRLVLRVGMTVKVMMGRVNRILVQGIALDVENASLVVIDPNRSLSHDAHRLHAECHASRTADPPSRPTRERHRAHN